MSILRLKDENGNVFDVPALVGKDGLSAYDIAVKNGFEGSETEWLDSLKVAEKEWKKIDEITFVEEDPIMSKTYNNLGGMTEFLFKVEGLTNNGVGNSGAHVVINGYTIKSQPIPVGSAATNYCYVELKFNGLYWKFVRTGMSTNVTNWGAAAENTPYNIEIVDGLAPAETMVISQHPTYFAKAGTLIIYGR